MLLTHSGRVTHICISNQTIIGSDNGLLPDRRQAITWTNAGILLIGPLGTNFSEILVEIYTLSLKKMHLKMSSGKWRSFCLGLNVLSSWAPPTANFIGPTLAQRWSCWLHIGPTWAQRALLSGTSCEIALKWMPQNTCDDNSTLVQAMAWCNQAPSHYLNQYRPSSLTPYGVTGSQWVNNPKEVENVSITHTYQAINGIFHSAGPDLLPHIFISSWQIFF